MNKKIMNKPNDKPTNKPADELQAHYAFDYSKAKPNRFAARLTHESVMVVLDLAVVAVFPTMDCFLQLKQIDEG